MSDAPPQPPTTSSVTETAPSRVTLQEPEALQRFLRYVEIATTSSDTSTHSTPSTPQQFDLAHVLVAELQAIGLSDAAVDPHTCVVTATVPASSDVTTATNAQGIALLAHLDTSPDAPGSNVHPQIHTIHANEDVVLADGAVRIAASDLAPYVGQRVVTSDGTTLLGADDKSGIAIIMTAIAQLLRRPQPATHRPMIKVIFTPDEEVGRGTEGIDVATLKKTVFAAYTVDGDKIGTLETETFSARAAVLEVVGVGVHPGYAFGRMANAAQIAADFAARLPREQRPDTTQDRQGYIHLCSIEGNVEHAKAKFIIREFDDDKMETLLQTLRDAAEAVRAANPRATITLQITQQYENMAKYMSPDVVNAAAEAYRLAGLEPELKAIRGGTDGARLSAMGIPCPNIFAGGMLFHSRSEFLPVDALLKGVDVIAALIDVWGRRLLPPQQH